MIAIMFAELEPMLSGLPARELSFATGQSLFHLGDPVQVMHFVETGAVQLARHHADGAELILQRAGPGSILAEASLYSQVYHCDATAVGPARTRVVRAADLRRRLLAKPEFSDVWARRLARELQSARLRAEFLSLKTVARRLDAWIAWKDGVLPGKGEWKAIAGQLRVSPEALYREIAKRRKRPPHLD